MLGELHPDYASYIHAVRVIRGDAAAPSAQSLYSGLVRSGGADPREKKDAPASGWGARNDIVLFPAALDPARSDAWRRLILDHEYFHARHLARGWSVPLVDFGDAAATHDFYEAAAWGYVRERAARGTYGELTAAETREVRAIYERHFQAIRAFILERQPAAWTHFRRFMPDTDDDGARRQAPGEREGSMLSASRTAPGAAAVTASAAP